MNKKSLLLTVLMLSFLEFIPCWGVTEGVASPEQIRQEEESLIKEGYFNRYLPHASQQEKEDFIKFFREIDFYIRVPLPERSRKRDVLSENLSEILPHERASKVQQALKYIKTLPFESIPIKPSEIFLSPQERFEKYMLEEKTDKAVSTLTEFHSEFDIKALLPYFFMAFWTENQNIYRKVVEIFSTDRIFDDAKIRLRKTNKSYREASEELLVNSYDFPIQVAKYYKYKISLGIPSFTQYLEKSYDTFIKNDGTLPSFGATRESFLATLWGLKHLTKDGALSEWKALQIDHPRIAKKVDEQIFLGELDKFFRTRPSIFKLPLNNYSKRKWKGHRTLHEVPDHTFLPSGSVDVGHMKVTVLGAEKEIQWSILKTAEAPKYIIVDIYAGYDRNFCQHLREENFGDSSIWSVAINLWDCTSPINQTDQVNSHNFSHTHASYLFAVSQIIDHLQKEYPHSQIYLYGKSFGGFFVTSYALLQSTFYAGKNLKEIYEDFVSDAFEKIFPTHQIAPVKGIISCSGALFLIPRIIRERPVLKSLEVPGFFSFNYDDDRVLKEYIKDELISSPYISLFVSREAATPYGEEIEGGYIGNSTKRGHGLRTPYTNITQQQAIIDFVKRVGRKQPLSKIHEKTQERRLKIFQGQRLPAPYITQQDVEQYLSNQTFLQYSLQKHQKREEEARLEIKTGHDQADKPLSLEPIKSTPAQLLDYRMQDIEAVYIKSLVDMSLESDLFAKAMDKFVSFSLPPYSILIENYKRGDLDAWALILKKFEENKDSPSLKKLLTNLPMNNSKFRTILEKNKILIDRELHDYTSTKDMWKEGIRKVVVANKVARALKAGVRSTP